MNQARSGNQSNLATLSCTARLPEKCSSAVQDGRSATITAPSGPAQQRCINASLQERGGGGGGSKLTCSCLAAALSGLFRVLGLPSCVKTHVLSSQYEDFSCSQEASVKALEVSLVEVHGTGTSLGDPIEVGGMKSTLGKGRTEDAPLVLAATKSIIGHTEGPLLHVKRFVRFRENIDTPCLGSPHTFMGWSWCLLAASCLVKQNRFPSAPAPRFCRRGRPHQDDRRVQPQDCWRASWNLQSVISCKLPSRCEESFVSKLFRA